MGKLHPESSLICNTSQFLQYVLPFARAPCKLTDLKVDMCESLKFIFIENATAEKEEADVMELRFLKSLDLSYLDHLVSLSGSENLSGNGDSVHGNQAFFNPRISLPSLEQLSLMRCNKIIKLWDKELGVSGFQSLQTIKIAICGELSSVGPLSIVSNLVQLERLTIINCNSMHEVISDEGVEELETRDQVVIFPQLKDLVITNSSILKSFYGGRFKLKFPKLKNLQLYNLCCLKNFSGSENQSFLFHEEVDFLYLEELSVSSIEDEVMGLWDWHLDGESTLLLNPVPKLRKLRLCDIKGLRLIPSEIYHILSSLELTKFNDEVLLSPGKEGSVLTYSELPKLKDLCVGYNDCLTDLLRDGDFNAAAALTFCGQLKKLTLIRLPRLKIFPWHLFKSLCVLNLDELNWEYVVAADTLIQLQQSLQQLEALYIQRCGNMRVVIQYDGEVDADMVFEFPRLKLIHISNSSIIGFSSTVNATLCLPSIEEIRVETCKAIQNFWSGPIIVPNLKEVVLDCCDTMQSFLAGNSNQLVELQSLQSVRLNGCLAMRYFSSRPVTAPHLMKIDIKNCSQIQWFLPHHPNDDDVLDLPSLKVVYVSGCPRMQSFSTGSLRTPNIYLVNCDRKSKLVAGLEINLNHLL